MVIINKKVKDLFSIFLKYMHFLYKSQNQDRYKYWRFTIIPQFQNNSPVINVEIEEFLDFHNWLERKKVKGILFFPCSLTLKNVV